MQPSLRIGCIVLTAMKVFAAVRLLCLSGLILPFVAARAQPDIPDLDSAAHQPAWKQPAAVKVDLTPALRQFLSCCGLSDSVQGRRSLGVAST